MEPTEEEKSTIVTLIENAEKEVSKKLGLVLPKKKGVIGFDYSPEASAGAYFPYREDVDIEDSYVFKVGISKEQGIEETIEEIITHEAVHRLYYWTLAMNADTTPKGYLDMANESMRDLAKGNTNKFGALKFFDKVLVETFGYWGEMVTLSKEHDVLYANEDFLKAFFPEKSEKRDTFFRAIEEFIKVKRLQEKLKVVPSLENTTLFEFYPTLIGHLIALINFRKFGIDEHFIKKFVNYFTDYDLRKEKYNPYFRFRRIVAPHTEDIRIFIHG